VWAKDPVLEAVSQPPALVQNGVDGVERVEVWFPEAKNRPHRVPVYGDSAVAIRALENEWVGESRHEAVEL
jgi:hypothetical protein